MILFCYPLSFSSHLSFEHSDKVILPSFALENDIIEQLAEQDSPLVIKLENAATNRIMYCGLGITDPTAEYVYAPDWITKNLLLNDGDPISVTYELNVLQASKVIFSPTSHDFFEDIVDQKVVLESALKDFVVLTLGQEIKFIYNDKTYYLNVSELYNDGGDPCVFCCITNCDLVVDFNNDFLCKKKQERKQMQQEQKQTEQHDARFPGIGRRLGRKRNSGIG